MRKPKVPEKHTTKRISDALALLEAAEDIDVSSSRTTPAIQYVAGGFIAGRGDQPQVDTRGARRTLSFQDAVLELAQLCRY